MKKTIIILAAIIILGAIGFFTFEKQATDTNKALFEEPSTKSTNTPEGVVRYYLTAWREKNYSGMYSVFSDGFKKIEPTSSTLASFTDYTKSQGIDYIEIKSIEEKYNSGEEAGVAYDVTFFIHDEMMPYQGTFTLKYRKNDEVPGWKMIHPYGDNIDTS